MKENQTPQDSQGRQHKQDPNHDASNGPHTEGSAVFSLKAEEKQRGEMGSEFTGGTRRESYVGGPG